MNQIKNHLNPLKTPGACLILSLALLWPLAPAQAQDDRQQAPRQDYTMGTTHEGIVMETDPQTGDRVIQVTPPPREEKQTQEPPVLLIQPEIKIKTD